MMAQTKRRKKAYRPKPVSDFGGLAVIDAHYRAASLNQLLSDDQITDLGIAYHMAFKDMVNGHANEQNWAIVVASLNIAVVLAERVAGGEYLACIVQAMEGAMRAKARAAKSGQWGFDGDAIKDIQTALEIHDAQVECSTKAEMRAALIEVRRRVSTGHTYQEAACSTH